MSRKSKDVKDEMIPSWINPMLNAKFFNNCVLHGELTNMFCLICKRNSLCSSCLIKHKNHPIIQIRRSSYHNVIRLDDVSSYIDASNIQTYRNNNVPVIFINHRPITRPGKSYAFACEICGRTFLDPFKFCSLRCKLEGVKNGKPRVTFELENEFHKLEEKKHESEEENQENLLRRCITEQTSSEGQNSCNSSDKTPNSNCLKTTPPVNPYRTHVRKGIARRSPFS